MDVKSDKKEGSNHALHNGLQRSINCKAFKPPLSNLLWKIKVISMPFVNKRPCYTTRSRIQILRNEDKKQFSLYWKTKDKAFINATTTSLTAWIEFWQWSLHKPLMAKPSYPQYSLKWSISYGLYCFTALHTASTIQKLTSFSVTK